MGNETMPSFRKEANQPMPYVLALNKIYSKKPLMSTPFSNR